MNEIFYHLLWIFAIYSCLGWCAEVIYATVNTGKFVNRGFLNGPYCPIYGLGIVIVVSCLMPIKDNLFFLFVGSIVLASGLEFITGLALEKLFNQKWWDYSEVPFNIKGYICLKASLVWGIACILVLNVLQPLMEHFIIELPVKVGVLLLVAFYSVFLVDIVIAIITLRKVYQRHRMILEIEQKIEQKIKYVSDRIGVNISEGVLNAMKANEHAIIELDEMKAKYHHLTKKKIFGFDRLVSAYPRLQVLKHRTNPWKK